jgi:hypothetical protein
MGLKKAHVLTDSTAVPHSSMRGDTNANKRNTMIHIRKIRDKDDAQRFLAAELDELSRFPKRQTIVIVSENDQDSAAVFADYESWWVGTASPNTSIPGEHFLIKKFPARSPHL